MMNATIIAETYPNVDEEVKATASLQKVSTEPLSIIKLHSMEKDEERLDFREALGLTKKDTRNVLIEIKSVLVDPTKQALWKEYANDVVAYLQSFIAEDYRGEITKQELHLVGKILQMYKPYVTL